MSTPGSPPTIPLPMRVTSAPQVPAFVPFPQARFPSGVSAGPLAALVALLAGAAGLLLVAALGDGTWPDWRIPGALVIVAAAAYGLLWAGLVEPVRSFGDAMVRMATEDRAELVPRARLAELDRVAMAMYRYRRIRLGRRGSRARRRIPMVVAP
ncbi:MAG: hypothetical protein ACRDQ0_18290, partial [Pseudonocardia sp.]